MSASNDDSDQIVQIVHEARNKGKQLCVVGHGSKSFLAPPTGELASTSDHVGIEEYDPKELVLVARAGTPLSLIEEELEANNQMLPFEPPRYGGRGTLGGAVASGLSGPGRPWLGSVRDCVLGITMLNGLGEKLKFGGKVIKNVAGFDISRVMAGSRGRLGVLLSIAVKLIPKPRETTTWETTVDSARLAELYRGILNHGSSITASCFLDGRLSIRVNDTEVPSFATQFDSVSWHEVDAGLWTQLRDQSHNFFANSGSMHLWQLNRGNQWPDASTTRLEEWHGTRVWTYSREPLEQKPTPELGSAENWSGQAQNWMLTPFEKQLKAAFDPHGIFAA